MGSSRLLLCSGLFLAQLFLFGAAPADIQPRSSTGFISAPSDSAYNANHPCLLFERSELPGLQQKVRDGGRDDTAFAFIQMLVRDYYPIAPEQEIMQITFGLNVPLDCGLAAHLETPPDTGAMNFGRHWTNYIADNFEPDNNVFYSPLRMRALALGYDMFFAGRPDPERARIRDEILAYMDITMSDRQFERWLYSPYVSNISAMIGSALGLAAICLKNEIDPGLAASAIDRADQFVDAWLQALLDPGGTYSEGAMYAGWSMRNLAYYFWARKRCYDGYDYSNINSIRNMEKWFAFAVLPFGWAQINNINDTASFNKPLARHHTYFDWAQTAWGSSLSAWVWERLAGSYYGFDARNQADKAATVLWHQNIPPQPPDQVLPGHFLWEHRGLYYFRTGWPGGWDSDDLVFSFYSGKFYGGHKHEEQNSFTLYGYKSSFAPDNGFGGPARHSEAHNMVFIDGKGQHNAGGSIGTDGSITEHLLSDFADYLLGDATEAYNTYSEFNRAGYPFPDDDWSWGYDGGNPVEHALRRVLVVHGDTLPPYVLIIDDIEKDGLTHRYSWRMHTSVANTVDTTANPIKIQGENGLLNLVAIHPAYESLEKELIPYDNDNDDPNTTIISLSIDAINPRYSFLLMPLANSFPAPAIEQHYLSWGLAVHINWSDETRDIVLLNHSRDTISYGVPAESGADIPISTDAEYVVIRAIEGRLKSYLALNAGRLSYGNILFLGASDSRINCAKSGSIFHIDPAESNFKLYAPAGGWVYYRDEEVPVVFTNGYLIPDPTRGSIDRQKPPGFIKLHSYPNPFKHSASIVVSLEQRAAVAIAIYDISGSLVYTAWNGPLPEGSSLFQWNGRNQAGDRVASGVYYITATGNNYSRSQKITLVR